MKPKHVPQNILEELAAVISHQHHHPTSGSYTASLFARGAPHIRRKIIEEAGETVTAESPQQIRAESADLIYHLMVYWQHMGVTLEEVLQELHNRARQRKNTSPSTE